MRRLGGAVNDQVEALFGQKGQHALSVADVELDVLKARRGELYPLLIPARVAVRSKEDRAHVVVDADDVRTQPVEITDGLGPDESVRSRDKDPHGGNLTRRMSGGKDCPVRSWLFECDRR